MYFSPDLIDHVAGMSFAQWLQFDIESICRRGKEEKKKTTENCVSSFAKTFNYTGKRERERKKFKENKRKKMVAIDSAG